MSTQSREGRERKRIAVLGLALESNAFAPVTTRQDFIDCGYGEGAAMCELGLVKPLLDVDGEGFGAMMRRYFDWELVPILFGSAGAGGPCDHAFFEFVVDEMTRRLREAGPLDGVYIIGHGAGLTTELDDLDGAYFSAVRNVVGPDTPIIATLDLHGNISEEMVERADILISFLTNPHLDMVERSAEAAALMCEMFAGMKPKTAFIRLPLVTPQVAQLTGAGHPYGDLIIAGQKNVNLMIANVSILSGFAFADTRHNGMAVIVTARGDQDTADRVASDLAERAWRDRGRYTRDLTSVEDAVALAREAQTGARNTPIILADVADNPGGGGRGNTTAILQALLDADIGGVQFGVFYDPALVRQAHAAGEGAMIEASFASGEASAYSEPFTAAARVLKVTDGKFDGTHGMTKGRPLDLGPSCLLQVSGVAIAIISIRQQIFGADAFEHFGLDSTAAKTIVVKSRGHFRAGFEHIVDEKNIFEVDAPGLTTPNLSRIDWRRLSRSVYPLNKQREWAS